MNGNTRSASSPQLSIESKYFVKNASNLVTRSGGLSFDSIPMCRVKVSNSGQEGYAIVSADERNAGVIAYVPNGKFENRDETGAGMMLKLSEATLVSEISEYESKRISSLKKIAKALGKDSLNKNDIEKVCNTKQIGTRSVAYEKPQSRIIKLIGPVTKRNGHKTSLITDCFQKHMYLLVKNITSNLTILQDAESLLVHKH